MHMVFEILRSEGNPNPSSVDASAKLATAFGDEPRGDKYFEESRPEIGWPDAAKRGHADIAESTSSLGTWGSEAGDVVVFFHAHALLGFSWRNRPEIRCHGRYGKSDCLWPGRANRFHRRRNRCHIPLRSWMTRPGPCHTSTAAAGLFSSSRPATRTASASDPHSTE
jgi:hypothetical protein